MSRSRKHRRPPKKKAAPPRGPTTARLLPRDPIPIDESLTWFAVETWPGWEARVERTLKRHSVPVYWPIEKWRREHRGKRIDTIRSAFPGYLFVGMSGALWNWSRFALAVGWSGPAHALPDDIRSRVARAQEKARFAPMPGFIGPVEMDGEPIPIAGVVLAAIEERLTEAQEQRRGIVVRPGDRVRITGADVLSGLNGVVARVLTERLLEVEIELFGRATAVRLAATQIASP